MSRPGSFLLSPAKQNVGLHPVPVTIWNTSGQVEHLAVQPTEYAEDGATCQLGKAAPWARLSATTVTLRPHGKTKVGVTVHGVPPGLHDLAVVVSEQAGTGTGRVTDSVAAQEIVGHGQPTQCTAIRHTSASPVDHAAAFPLMPSVIGLGVVLVASVAAWRMFRPHKGTHR